MKIQALLSYWRSCLADSEHLSPQIRKKLSFPATFGQLEKGRLGLDVTDQIFAELEPRRAAKKRKNRGEDPEAIRSASVLIAPFQLHVVVEHGQRAFERGKGSRRHAPLWLSARIDRAGTLEGDPHLAPWIGRQYLEPSGRSQVVIGDLGDSDTFKTTRPRPEDPRDWASHLTYAADLFEAVTGGNDIESPVFPDTLPSGPVVLIKDEQIRAGKYLLDLYDVLRESPESCSRLLQRFVADPPQPRPVVDEVGKSPADERHLGHMNGAFGLQPSQRRAVHAALALQAGDTLAVNGPPGTGKTTLIQSVVASLWVERALEGSEPPVVHACSSNNRAIINILETFERAESGERPPRRFEERWVPKIGGYGLLMPSGRQARKMDGEFPMASKGFPEWDGLPKQTQEESFVRRARAAFLASARKALGVSGESVARVADRLREVLQSEAGRLRSIRALAGEVFERRMGHGATSRREFLTLAHEKIRSAKDEAGQTKALASELETALDRVTLWEDLLAFLPPIRSRRDDKVLAPFRNQDVTFQGRLSLANYRAETRDFVNRRMAEAEKKREEWELAARRETEFESRLEAVSAQSGLGESAQEALESPETLEALLDRTLRRHLFHLAGRYWEARWILETEAALEQDDGFTRRQDDSSCRQRFRRFAKLTPISVSTFYLLPKLFAAWNSQVRAEAPLVGLFDLLVVDEAGQTTPEVGAPALLYAERALVVGDEKQIQPIWGVDRTLDEANQARFGLDLSDVPDGYGLRSSAGSLMAMARRVSAWSDDASNVGLMLTEHWRCRPPLAEYCSRLAYGGRLDPKRPRAEDPPLPCLGWAHVEHPADSRGGSRFNRGQAVSIVAWLVDRKDWIRENYGELEHVVGIVTPFRAQVQEIRRELRDKGLSGIDVGTVHTFQGGEKDVMLFSPVYDSDHHGAYFFDFGPNMLNVAVSRARESFLVFGDMGIFRTGSASPSGLLADRLFADPSQEIRDVWTLPAVAPEPDVEAIGTLEGHRTLLAKAFGQAARRLLIVSPYLARNAVNQDEILEEISAAKERDVEVVVAYCRDLCREHEALEALVEDLRHSGAEVWALDRVHSKALAVDSEWIAIGSFNWLSAVRNADSKYHRMETSILCRRPRAVAMIEGIWDQLEQRRPPADR